MATVLDGDVVAAATAAGVNDQLAAIGVAFAAIATAAAGAAQARFDAATVRVGELTQLQQPNVTPTTIMQDLLGYLQQDVATATDDAQTAAGWSGEASDRQQTWDQFVAGDPVGPPVAAIATTALGALTNFASDQKLGAASRESAVVGREQQVIAQQGFTPLAPALLAGELTTNEQLRAQAQSDAAATGVTAAGTNAQQAGLAAQAQAADAVADRLASIQAALASIPDGTGDPDADRAIWETAARDTRDLLAGVSRAPNDSTPAADRRAHLGTALLELATSLSGRPVAAAVRRAGAAVPCALLPARLEVVAEPASSGQGGGTLLRVRIYPDTVHLDAFEPGLTPEEQRDGAALWSASTTGATVPDDAAWAALAARHGGPRARYLAAATAPGAPAPPTRTAGWTRPVRAVALPARWVVVAYGADQTVLGATVGSPVPPDGVAVTVDPASAEQPTDDRPPLDAGTLWLADFAAATQAGLGVEFAVAGRPPVIDRLVAIGLASAIDPAAGATQLYDLLNAHRNSDELDLVPAGTPTNNTAADRAGTASLADLPAAAVFATPAPPGSDGDRLSGALGIATGLLQSLPRAGDRGQEGAGAMATVLWYATWDGLLRPAGHLDLLTAARDVFATAVRARGPLPTVRVGNQPYGLLPVLADRSVDALVPAGDPTDGTSVVATAVSRLRDTWLAAAPLAGTPSDADTLLEQRGTGGPPSARAFVQLGAATDPNWQLDGLDAATVARAEQRLADDVDALNARVGAVPIVWAQGVSSVPDVDTATGTPDVILPAVAPADADRSAPLSAADNALAALATDPTSTAGADSLLARMARLALGRAAADNATADLTAALALLAVRPVGELEQLFAETLDLAGFRLDAWSTALATMRLTTQRAATPDGLVLGGYGYLEQIPVTAAPESTGFGHAPSVDQAATASVLRSGYLAHVGTARAADGSAPLAIDQSAGQVRLAQYLLDGLRAGQSLGYLLGYRFERALRDAGGGAGVYIQPVRDYVAAHSASGTGPGGVVDGVALLAARAAGLPAQLQGAGGTTLPTAATALQQALVGLDTAFDAVADAVLAEGVHQAVVGNYERAAVTLSALVQGLCGVPELTFARTPSSGAAVATRLLLPLPVPGQLTGGWVGTARSAAEPAVDTWLAALLPDPAGVTAVVTCRDAAGTTVASGQFEVPLSVLGLAPSDLVATAATPELVAAGLAAHVLTVQRPAALPEDGTVDIQLGAAGDATSAAAALARAALVAPLLAGARPGDTRDLLEPGASTDDGRDDTTAADLTTRAATARSAAVTTVAALTGARNAAERRTALAAAAAFDPSLGASPGIADSAPAVGAYRFGPVPTDGWAAQASRAAQVLTRRVGAFDALALDSGADRATTITARFDQLAALFGSSLTVVATGAGGLGTVAAAVAATDTDGSRTGGPPAPGGVLTWLGAWARARPAAAAVLDLALFGAAAFPVPTRVAQLPVAGPDPERWIGLPVVDDTAAVPSTNLLLAGTVALTGGDGRLRVLVLDRWTEAVPAGTRTTGVSFGCPAPIAQAPQAILLAPFPADADPVAGWDLDELLAAVTDTMTWSRVRALDPAALPEDVRVVLPASFIPDDPVTGIPITDLTDAPAGFATPTGFYPPQLSSVTHSIDVPGAILTVTGTNLATAATTVTLTVSPNGPTVGAVNATSVTIATTGAAAGRYTLTARATDATGAVVGTSSIAFQLVRAHATAITGPGSGGLQQSVARTASGPTVYPLTAVGYGLAGATVGLQGPTHGLTVAKTGADTDNAIALHLSVPVVLAPAGDDDLTAAGARPPALLPIDRPPLHPEPPHLTYTPATIQIVVTPTQGDPLVWPIAVLLASYEY